MLYLDFRVIFIGFRERENKQIVTQLKWTEFDYKLVCNQFVATYYVAAYKTIHMYYLKKSHDLLNESCDFFK